LLWFRRVFFCIVLCLISFLFVGHVWLIEWKLIEISRFRLRFTFIFDFFSFFFSAVVLLIASIIFFFAQYYIDKDKTLRGFGLLLCVFVVSMLCLIFSPNLFSLLLGWDGLGLTSYLLVIYYASIRRSVAGMVTFLINRVGDIFFLVSISILACLTVLEFTSLKETFFICSIMICVAFITKRAQVPFSSWLPAAIAAPTPVSSLVHSSTLVTAGVYLLVRFRFSIKIIFSFLIVFAIITIFLAGVIAMIEWDMKKIIAYSTLSQLGFMVFSLRAYLVFFCFFHLLCHALFKASLFIRSGVLIHNSDRGQEFRNSFDFNKVAPLVRARVSIRLLCLCGFPFLSGFLSKDLILDGLRGGLFFFVLFIIAVSFTFVYRARFFIGCFKGGNVSVRFKKLKTYEVVVYLVCPVWRLSLCSVFLGVFWAEITNELAGSFTRFLGVWKGFYLCLFVVVLRVFFRLKKATKWRTKKYFLSSIWFLSQIITGKTMASTFKIAYGGNQKVDQAWQEIWGPQGLSKCFVEVSFFFFRGQSYLFFLFFFPLLVTFVLFSWKNSLKKCGFEETKIRSFFFFKF
jgi:NADH-ubiquinone oxidoreductase chain 5